jgi:hypothetical protein
MSGKDSFATFHPKLLRKFTKLAASNVKFLPGKTIGLTARFRYDRKYRARPGSDTQFPHKARPKRVKHRSEGGLIGVDPALEYDK